VKRVCVVVVCLVAVCGLCPPVPAQGIFGEGALTSGAGYPCAWGAGGITMPRVYVGWLEQSKGSTWTIERADRTGTAAWPLKGLWLGATEEFTGCDGIGLLVSGSLFIPRHSSGTWLPSPQAADFNFEIPSYGWWSIDGLVTKRVSGAFELVGGLRWDHSSIRVAYRDNTDDDYILNAYIPLVGVQVAQKSCNGSLTVRFMGTPVVLGGLKYHFWTGDGYSESGNFAPNNSYFMELFAEYSWCMGNNITAGGFAKWNSLSIKTRESHLAGSTTEPVRWGVGIQSLVVGGSVSVGFSSPL
jgi:hypothetical protein